MPCLTDRPSSGIPVGAPKLSSHYRPSRPTRPPPGRRRAAGGPMTAVSTDPIDRLIQEHSPIIRRLVASVEQIVVGQENMVEGLVISLLTGGHVLLEGVPGLAKTLTVSTLA